MNYKQWSERLDLLRKTNENLPVFDMQLFNAAELQTQQVLKADADNLAQQAAEKKAASNTRGTMVIPIDIFMSGCK